jgi:membrane-bound serine protease (ClpP class)
LSLGYIIPGVVITAGFFVFVVGRGLRAQFLPVRTGRETLIGKVVKAEDPIDRETGRVFVEGEYWNAVSDTPIEAGRPVEIVAVQRLVLKVKPKP